MLTYFVGVTTLDDLKKTYRHLAMQYHPDCGGDAEKMKAINTENQIIQWTISATNTDRT